LTAQMVLQRKQSLQIDTSFETKQMYREKTLDSR
jgi:hypothetical protein